MTIIILFINVFVITTALADEPLKVCQTTLQMGSKATEAEFSFLKNRDSYSARISYPGVGAITKEATINEFQVRSNLDVAQDSDEYIDSLNEGERYILHALMLAQDAQMEDFTDFLSEGKMENECSAEDTGFNSGIDLKKVSHVKVFEIQGDPGDMGKVSVIEAKDKDGNLLGSFLGGFLVSPCR